MSQSSVVSPEDQGATFVELFFDLVFVFAITQVTQYAAHHLDLQGVLRSVLVFWLIWWGWTQFTWALNAANTDHHGVRLGTLVATAIAFAMAASVGKAFDAGWRASLWFAVSYVGVRAVGIALYYRVVFENTAHRRAVASFAAFSVAGLLAVLAGGFLPPTIRVWLWCSAVAFDLGAAWFAGNRQAWGVNAAHFAERHGLIVIIAMGESLIVAGSALTTAEPGPVLIAGGLAVLLTCLLWWTYFGWVREVLERRLILHTGRPRAMLARDAYTLWHFPLVCGIVASAIGFEAVFHPTDFTLDTVAVALGVGLTLFLGSTAAALWRAERCVLWNRLIVLGITLLGLYFSARSSSIQLLAVVCAGLGLIIAIEHVTVRRRLAQMAVE